MKTKSTDLQQFMDKVKNLEQGHQFDLSSGEDLSIAVMNLISIEEHMFFNGNKTGKTEYFELLNEAREMRKSLMKMLIPDYEGEVWCTSKHLLAASMRVMEVGTKYQTKGDQKTAYDLFQKSFNLYNLFWGINLGIAKDTDLKSTTDLPALSREGKGKGLDLKKSDFLGKISNTIGKILDCCRE